MASVNESLNHINQTCRNKGGKYAQYSCKTVSWDDAARGTVGGSLSCWGSNITDTYLNAKDGRRLFTVRSDNWNEKLGYMSSKDVALVTGNQNLTDNKSLEPITLQNFLKNISKYGKYAGIESSTDLDHIDLDKKISIRFQTTFLPVDEGEKTNLEFCTEAYNYNTKSDTDPRNLVLLCTTQGLALQQDGSGSKKLFHHSVDNNGIISRHWLEAEKSRHKVGGSQVETVEEKKDAIARGKATSSVIGIKAMGTRFNVLMTIQIPLEQKKVEPRYPSFGGVLTGGGDYNVITYEASNSMYYSYAQSSESMDFLCAAPMKSMKFKSSARSDNSRNLRRKSAPKVGTANAARVSQGSKHDTWSGLTKTNPKRNSNEHITVTCVIYNTSSGGVPSELDIYAAIDDMENLYSSCTESGNLADSKFDFMKKELTVKDTIDIQSKIIEQPASKTVTGGVNNFDQFPE